MIDATEIANASAVLLTLDKNSDGQLTREEFLGKRPGPPPGFNRGNGAGGPPAGEGGDGNPPPADAPPAEN